MNLNNKSKLVVLILGVAMFLGACTSKALYDMSHENKKQECERKFEGQAREDCMRGYELSYEEYKRERESIIKKD